MVPQDFRSVICLKALLRFAPSRLTCHQRVRNRLLPLFFRPDRARIDPIEQSPELHIRILYGCSRQRDPNGASLWRRYPFSYVVWTGTTFWPMERCERSSGAGLGVLETVCFIDDEDGPRETVEMRYRAPRGVKRRDDCNMNTYKNKSCEGILGSMTHRRQAGPG